MFCTMKALRVVGVPLDRVCKMLVAAHEGADLLSAFLLQEGFKLCKLNISAIYDIALTTCRVMGCMLGAV